MTSTAIATTGSGFTGADVDGLDKLSQEFTQAAQVCDEVKMACEVIVAVASMFGPFGAAFVAYLKGTVIPWLTKISEALNAMAKVLSMHSQAQKDTSSNATSLPSYQSPTNLPQTNTQNYPTMPLTAPTSAGVGAGSASAPAGAGSSVAAPPSIGGTTSTGAPTTAATGAAAASPAISRITALTGLVTAVDHLLHPTSGTAATATPISATPIITTPIDGTALGSTPVDPTTGTVSSLDPSTGIGSSSPGTSAGLGSSGAIDLSTLSPLHPGDTVGVLNVPVDISPDGKITPLIHTAAASVLPTGGSTPIAAISATAAHLGAGHASMTALHGAGSSPQWTTPTHATALPGSGSSGGSGGGLGGGSGSGGGVSGGSDGGSVIPSVAPAHVAAPHVSLGAAHHAASSGSHDGTGAGGASVSPAGGPGGSHDGLYSGLGQATGIGAGGAALARAALREAHQRTAGGLLNSVTLPFDGAADGAAQAHILDGELR